MGVVSGLEEALGFTTAGLEKSGTALALNAVEAAALSLLALEPASLLGEGKSDSLIRRGDPALLTVAKLKGVGVVSGLEEALGFTTAGLEKSGTALALNAVGAVASLPALDPNSLLGEGSRDSRTRRGDPALFSVSKLKGFCVVSGLGEILVITTAGLEKSGTGLALNAVGATALSLLALKSDTFPLLGEGRRDSRIRSVAKLKGFCVVSGLEEVLGFTTGGFEKSGTGLALNAIDTAAASLLALEQDSLLGVVTGSALLSLSKWNGVGVVSGLDEVLGFIAATCNREKSGTGIALNARVAISSLSLLRLSLVGETTVDFFLRLGDTALFSVSKLKGFCAVRGRLCTDVVTIGCEKVGAGFARNARLAGLSIFSFFPASPCSTSAFLLRMKKLSIGDFGIVGCLFAQSIVVFGSSKLISFCNPTVEYRLSPFLFLERSRGVLGIILFFFFFFEPSAAFKPTFFVSSLFFLLGSIEKYVFSLLLSFLDIRFKAFFDIFV